MISVADPDVEVGGEVLSCVAGLEVFGGKKEWAHEMEARVAPLRAPFFKQNSCSRLTLRSNLWPKSCMQPRIQHVHCV